MDIRVKFEYYQLAVEPCQNCNNWREKPSSFCLMTIQSRFQLPTNKQEAITKYPGDKPFNTACIYQNTLQWGFYKPFKTVIC